MNSSVNHLGNGEEKGKKKKKFTPMFCALCGMTDCFFMLELIISPPNILPSKILLFSAVIHQRWPPFISPPVHDLGAVLQILYSVEQILRVSSLDPTFVFKGPFFHSFLCEISLPPSHSLPPSFFLCALVQLATAEELIIAGIEIIIIPPRTR